MAAERCQHCGIRPATVNWVGAGGTLDYVHGLYQRWCEYCATEAQLTYARERAADIPNLERRLAELEASDGG